MSGLSISGLAIFALALAVAAFAPGPGIAAIVGRVLGRGRDGAVAFVTGMAVGDVVWLSLAVLGLAVLAETFHEVFALVKYAGAAYLLYLAWKIASSRSMGGKGEERAQPMRFLDAAAFQWVNPKAWVMAVTAMAVYSNADRPYLSVVLVSVAFAVVNLPSVSVWAGFGMALRGFLSDPTRLKWFNIAMGVLLAATLWPMLR